MLGFSTAAWKLAPRDAFIGWTPQLREKNLPLVVDNPRFLILHWVKIPNLGSHLLAIIRRRLPDDWTERYNTTLVIIETFVETPRYTGAVYRASGRQVLLVYQQQQRPAETASSCSSVMFGSGGNARCTVSMSLSWTTTFIESGIVMPNSALMVDFGSASNCCLKSASRVDLSTICFNISSPLLMTVLLCMVR